MRLEFVCGVFAVAGMVLALGCAEEKSGKQAIRDHYIGEPGHKSAPKAKGKDVDFSYSPKSSPVKIRPVSGPSQPSKPGFFDWLFSSNSKDGPFAGNGAKPAPKTTTRPAPMPLPEKNMAPSGGK